jgi:hypothetical protein
MPPANLNSHIIVVCEAVRDAIWGKACRPYAVLWFFSHLGSQSTTGLGSQGSRSAIFQLQMVTGKGDPMRFTDGKGLDWIQSSGQRGGHALYKPLLRGSPRTLDNYEFSIFTMDDVGNFSPRHRHNFEQYRYAIEGPTNYARNRDIEEGDLGYFPEGTFYGPFTTQVGSKVLVLQCGGPCGDGFMDYEEWKRAFRALDEKGTFNRGTYHYIDASGVERNVDGWQAIWEHVNGRKLEFPKGRYADPVVVHSAAFRWVPVEGSPGVSIKRFGTFSELETGVSMLHLEEGAEYAFGLDDQTRLLFITKGELEIDGRSHTPWTAFELEKGVDAPTLRSVEQTEVLWYSLHRFPARVNVSAGSVI